MTKEDELKDLIRGARLYITRHVPVNCLCGKPNAYRKKLLEQMKKALNPDS